MNYSKQSPAQGIVGSGSRFIAGYVLVSLGILLATGGGSWDINNHLLNKPETFFAPPHAVLYTGAGSSVVGAVILFITSKQIRSITLPVKLVTAGVVMLVGSGPIDFAWHSTFGLDGLFSPPHFVLVSGMLTSSIGALAGMVHHGSMAFKEFRLSVPLIVIGVLPVWLAASGMIDMLSLPFSETDYFDFNPHPTAGVVVATLAFPSVISLLACISSIMAGRKFGVVTILGAAFIAISMLSSIVPNPALIPTIPFYAINIIPFVAADALMSFWKSRISVYAAGAILGVAFFTLYYPLIAYTYNAVIQTQAIIWPSMIMPTYFGMIGNVLPLVTIPGAAMGMFGAVIGEKVMKKKAL